LPTPVFKGFALARIGLGCLGRLEGVMMGGAVFLASDASALMTDAVLMFDGSRTSTS